MNDIYDDYDRFAYFYNKYWTQNPQKLMSKALDMLFLRELKKGSKILDLCCGVGNMAAFMGGKGMDITGLDGSREMLEYAKGNAPKAQFIHADARDFQLDNKFDAVTCLFDSVNHVLEQEGVKKLFQNVYDALNDGGTFVFDVNSLESAATASDMDFFAVNDDEVFLIKADFDNTNLITSYNMTAFLKEEGAWQRYDNTVYEKFYTPEELIKLINDVGFSSVGFADGSSLGIKGFKNRLFFKVGRG